jgi:hypothetical protein
MRMAALKKSRANKSGFKLGLLPPGLARVVLQSTGTWPPGEVLQGIEK